MKSFLMATAALAPCLFAPSVHAQTFKQARHRRTSLFVAAGLTVLAAQIGDAAAQSSTSPGSGDPIEVIIIRALPLNQRADQVFGNVAVLSGDELKNQLQATLGDTLSGIPGINSDTFGGGASRPIIRGQTSPRVRVLSDGSEIMDASAVSPDHAVASETLLLEGVEVLRGPSALLYGGGAIGGAVNLLDRKIPTILPENGFEGAFEVRGGTADNERAGVLGLTAGAGNFAFRLEAANRRSDDYQIPAYTPAVLAGAGAGHDEDHDDHDHHDHDHENELGAGLAGGPLHRVDGSFSRSDSYTLGASWIGSLGYLGIAFTDQASRYGAPGHSHQYEDCHPHGVTLHCGGHGDEHDHDHDDHEDGAGAILGAAGQTPWIDLKNRRFDLRGEIRTPFAGVERIRLRGGLTDYYHHEIDAGVIATTFSNKGHDARIEVEHAPIGNIRGVVGFQSSRSDFDTTGAEAFLPKNTTDINSIFLLEQYVSGAWGVEGAVRHEWQQTNAIGRPDASHNPFSISGAVNWTPMEGYSWTLALSRSQRAPNTQELYARGIHLATNTFEIGQVALKEEAAHAVELNFRKTTGPFTFDLGVYRHNFQDYIYAETLDQFETFRLVRYTQQDAVFSGIDGEFSYSVSPNLSLTVFGDYVRAKFNTGGDVPRIPAGRLGLRAEGKWDQWTGDIEFYRAFRQRNIAAFETSTPGYDMVNATIGYDVNFGGRRAQVFLRGTNLSDSLALNHASFIKDAAPLKGRNLILGMRASF